MSCNIKNSVKSLQLLVKHFDLDAHTVTLVVCLWFTFITVHNTRTHLVFSMEVKVDGEMQTHEFVCSPDDTMALCGVNEGSKLFIKVDPVSSQGHLDDDEYRDIS